ncbi:MAG: Bax inhibitor-1/YccA family protein [Actinomycetia bacterium]|nr:Bax inhibitor-1/YccA family protein [Actinomycetes bacterium]MCP4963564.1 Bax inhibitor-1/YccA family protein [Actinomycetes bacterium]
MASQRSAGILERQSSNPMLTGSAFKAQVVQDRQTGPIVEGSGVSDTWAAVAATFVVFAASFGVGWWLGGRSMAFAIIGAIVGLVLVLVTIFKPTLATVTTPIYAIAEGLFVGGISRVYEAEYSGIVLQASLLTAAIYFGMWFMFASGRLRLTPKMQKVIVTATFGVFAAYMLNMVMRLFGASVPFIHDSGPIGIGISLVIVGIASLNLLIDFDYIDRLNQTPHERWQDWFAAMGLLVTVVWIYIEILRLLSKLRD